MELQHVRLRPSHDSIKIIVAGIDCHRDSLCFAARRHAQFAGSLSGYIARALREKNEADMRCTTRERCFERSLGLQAADFDVEGHGRELTRNEQRVEEKEKTRMRPPAIAFGRGDHFPDASKMIGGWVT